MSRWLRIYTTLLLVYQPLDHIAWWNQYIFLPFSIFTVMSKVQFCVGVMGSGKIIWKHGTKQAWQIVVTIAQQLQKLPTHATLVFIFSPANSELCDVTSSSAHVGRLRALDSSHFNLNKNAIRTTQQNKLDPNKKLCLVEALYCLL